MPAIKLQHVVSVSSEDKNYPAENLLKNDGFKKWKCLSGEKNATVTFQFEKASEIQQIDIGNEGSAFVEVLVGKSSSNDDNYQVILMSSSFMNPAESRGSQNLNRVRIFGSDALSKATLDQKWDRAKVVCTQPFNKNVQYGLSFIKFHSTAASESADAVKPSPSKQLTLGAFVVKADPSTGDSIKAGSLFEKSKQKIEDPPPAGPAAIRAASKLVEKQSEEPSSGAEPRSIAPGPPPMAKVKSSESRRDEKVSTDQTTEAKKESKTNTKREAKGDNGREQLPPAKKSKCEPEASSSSADDKPFGKLMSRVVFVMSGFQNPLRGQLRDKAQEMGAVYKGDWGRGCTHLICAFESTPKYNEVKGKGRIVKKEWLLDCYKQKKLLPWRQYRLGRAASPKSDDSDDEKSIVTEKTRQPVGKPASDDSKLGKTKAVEEKKTETKNTNRNGERKLFHQMSVEDATESSSANGKESKGKALLKKEPRKPSAAAGKNDEDPFNASTDEDVPSTSAGKNGEDPFNASTDEDVPSTSAGKQVPNPFDASTDEEMGENDNGFGYQLPELPNFFGRKSFFLYGKFSQDARRTLFRYITAYNGLVIDYMDETIDYVVTDEPWDENFDQALTENSNLIFVKSSWILSCHEAQKSLPHQKFIVTAQ